jgi:hypothetical protein
MLPLPSRAQPVLELPQGSFIVLGPVDRNLSGNSSPKESVCYVSHLLVFIVSESLRVVLVIGCAFLFLLCPLESIRRASF